MKTNAPCLHFLKIQLCTHSIHQDWALTDCPSGSFSSQNGTSKVIFIYMWVYIYVNCSCTAHGELNIVFLTFTNTLLNLKTLLIICFSLHLYRSSALVEILLSVSKQFLCTSNFIFTSHRHPQLTVAVSLFDDLFWALLVWVQISLPGPQLLLATGGERKCCWVGMGWHLLLPPWHPSAGTH